MVVSLRRKILQNKAIQSQWYLFINESLTDIIKNLINDIMGARVENNLNNLDKKLSARVAAAVALEAAPYIPRKFTYYVGTGYSGGQAALAASFRKTSDNGRWSVTGGIAGFGVGGVTARIGFTGIID